MRTLSKGSGQISGEICMLACWHFKCPFHGQLSNHVKQQFRKKTRKHKKIWKSMFLGPGSAGISNGSIALDRKMCPDTLEALKLSVVFWKTQTLLGANASHLVLTVVMMVMIRLYRSWLLSGVCSLTWNTRSTLNARHKSHLAWAILNPWSFHVASSFS